MAENRSCTSEEVIGFDLVQTVEECASKCRGRTSIFIYGRDGFCSIEKGCICYCEAGASDDGTCDMAYFPNYDLYSFV